MSYQIDLIATQNFMTGKNKNGFADTLIKTKLELWDKIQLYMQNIFYCGEEGEPL